MLSRLGGLLCAAERCAGENHFGRRHGLNSKIAFTKTGSDEDERKLKQKVFCRRRQDWTLAIGK